MPSNASSPGASPGPGDAESVCELIVHEVADREGIEPWTVAEPLYDSINPEALETLFRGSSGRVTFEYMGYVVTVTHEHEVVIVDPDTE